MAGPLVIPAGKVLTEAAVVTVGLIATWFVVDEVVDEVTPLISEAIDDTFSENSPSCVVNCGKEEEVSPQPAPVTTAPAPILQSSNVSHTQSNTRTEESDSNDHCSQLWAEMKYAIDELKLRYDEMKYDRLDLYNKARSSPSPDLPPKAGTWNGHIHQYNGWQNRLNNLSDQARLRGCPEPPETNYWRYEKPPSFPAPQSKVK
jgi:hypothetical protein